MLINVYSYLGEEGVLFNVDDDIFYGSGDCREALNTHKSHRERIRRRLLLRSEYGTTISRFGVVMYYFAGSSSCSGDLSLFDIATGWRSGGTPTLLSLDASFTVSAVVSG